MTQPLSQQVTTAVSAMSAVWGMASTQLCQRLCSIHIARRVCTQLCEILWDGDQALRKTHFLRSITPDSSYLLITKNLYNNPFRVRSKDDQIPILF